MRPPTPRRFSLLGHTFVELLVTAVIMSILAMAALPIAAVSRKREREIELRRALREMRLALDAYHFVCRQSTNPTGGQAQAPQGTAPGQGPSVVRIKIEDDPDLTCYPKDLEVLLEGVETNIPRYRLRFLRRIPRDPFNRDDSEHDQFGWALRSTSDRQESNVGWDRRNVFDVRSGSEAQALDGSYYKDW